MLQLVHFPLYLRFKTALRYTRAMQSICFYHSPIRAGVLAAAAAFCLPLMALNAQTATVRQTMLSSASASFLAFDAPEAIQKLAPGSWRVTLTGSLNSGTLSKVHKALVANENIRVQLDLSAVSGLALIENKAFADCTNLVQIVLPDGVVSVHPKAFSGCTALSAFEATEANERFSTQNGLLYTKDGTRLVLCPPAAAGTVRIESAVTEISLDAFSASSGIEAFSVAGGNSAFTERNGVLYSKDMRTLFRCAPARENEVSVADGVTRIGKRAFDGCTKLRAVTLPESITELEELSFGSCKALTELTLPAQLTTIGKQAFFGCTALDSLAIPANVASIGSRAFYRCSLESLSFANSSGWHYGRKTISDIGDSAQNPDKFAFPGKYWPYDIYRTDNE